MSLPAKNRATTRPAPWISDLLQAREVEREYRSESLGVRRGPCRVMRIDLETGDPTAYVDVPSRCGHAGGLAVGGDDMLYVADTHTLFATPLAQAFEPGAR
ncbi:MAG TPA: hypothetical protein VNZ53_22230, partial [Steroidobacteraceae bacterium]|nr:hypothetical protein [Steroidobacteraceae bacterium]